MTSFFSEHTAEFALVPRLRNILATRFKDVTPIYFWKTREGNSLSTHIHKNQVVRVLALFPRRPKLVSPESRTIWGKINQELMKFAHASYEAGIPAIVGLPLARSLTELCNSCEPMWIALDSNCLEDSEDILFEVDVLTRKIVSVLPDRRQLNIKSEEEIPTLLTDAASPMAWSESTKLMGSLRTGQYNDNFISRFFFLGGYKPVYLIVFGDL